MILSEKHIYVYTITPTKDELKCKELAEELCRAYKQLDYDCEIVESTTTITLTASKVVGIE